jgi:hypothetical protein
MMMGKRLILAGRNAIPDCGSVLTSNQEAFDRKVRQVNRKARQEKPKLGHYPDCGGGATSGMTHFALFIEISCRAVGGAIVSGVLRLQDSLAKARLFLRSG